MAVDPQIKTLVEALIASGKNKRARLALEYMLEHGEVSTDTMSELGYSHPPRAIGDVKDAGIPIVARNAKSPKTGRRMAIYSFGDPNNIQEGRIGGRSALPKAFKEKLIVRYGSIDCITGAKLDPRVLQMDHRIPYRIAGDAGLGDQDVESYMLLDASSQRAKSWSCENCPNMITKDLATCQTCFWAFPENYKHIATEQLRRTDIVWMGEDVRVHDALAEAAAKAGTTPAEIIKKLVRQMASAS